MKKAYRFPPCPAYDIEAMEFWLEDMARKGLILTDWGIFDLAVFEKGTPQNLRFRLEPAPKQAGIINEYDEPPAAARELNADFGWRYVTRRDQFYIYCTDDPAAPELNTDPQIQALTLNLLSRRMQRSLIASIAHLIVLYLLHYRGTLLSYCIVMDLWFMVTLAVSYLLSLSSQIASQFHMAKLHKKLRQWQPLTPKGKTKGQVILYYVNQSFQTLLPLLLLVGCICIMARTDFDENAIALEEYDNPLPFATMAEFYPDGERTYEENSYKDSAVFLWDSALTPVNYEYYESSEVKFDDGSAVSGSLWVVYHEAVSPAIARGLAQEHVDQDRNGVINSDKYTTVPISGIEADFLNCYQRTFTTVVVACVGNTCVRVSYHHYSGSHELTPQELAQIVVSSIS